MFLKNDYFCEMQEFKRKIEQILGKSYDKGELRNIYFLLVEEITGLSRTKLLANTDYQFSAEERKKAKQLVDKLANNIPVQYAIGRTEFYGLPFFVDKNVLIPRPETEELVEWILNDVNKNSTCSILDIGTGSGCIAIALKSRLNKAEVSALDVSVNAIEVARKNSELNQTDITFLKADITQQLEFAKKWEIIVSNPPYIPLAEKSTMSNHVVEIEPSIALFVPDNDAMLFYRSVLQFAEHHLSENGTIYVEIHQNLTKYYLELFEKYSYQAEVRKDLSGNDRMIKAYKKRIK